MVVGKYIMQKPVDVEALMVETPLISSYYTIGDFLDGVKDIKEVSISSGVCTSYDGTREVCSKSDDECITITLYNGTKLKPKPYDYVIKERSEHDNSYKLYVMNYNDFNEKFSPVEKHEIKTPAKKENEKTDDDGGVTW